MYKEVEINSQEELALHLINEGDLYAGDQYAGEEKTRLFFGGKGTPGPPFKVEIEVGIYEAMKAYWDTKRFAYYKKVEWFESIPEGKKVPCYVSDEDSSDKTVADTINKYAKDSKHPYRSLSSLWKYATPIPADELWVPES